MKEESHENHEITDYRQGSKKAVARVVEILEEIKEKTETSREIYILDTAITKITSEEV